MRKQNLKVERGMKHKDKNVSLTRVESLILTVRGQKVILDSDLARVYGVLTARLNEQVKRNLDRFPEDFCFQLTAAEWVPVQSLRSQNAIINRGRGKHRKYLPFVFTEHGAIMVANVLRSTRAVRMSVFVVRAFVKMRETLAANKVLAEKLTELERKLSTRLDVHERAILQILGEIRKLMAPASLPVPPKRRIGFRTGPEAGSRRENESEE